MFTLGWELLGKHGRMSTGEKTEIPSGFKPDGRVMRKVEKAPTEYESYETEVSEMHSESKTYSRETFHKSKETWHVDNEVLQRLRF